MYEMHPDVVSTDSYSLVLSVELCPPVRGRSCIYLVEGVLTLYQIAQTAQPCFCLRPIQ